jgi:antitoxin component of RelBE/YafQ-DinJ toxin-antitoxin module
MPSSITAMRLWPNERAALEKLAKKRGLTLSEVIRRILQEAKAIPLETTEVKEKRQQQRQEV